MRTLKIHVGLRMKIWQPEGLWTFLGIQHMLRRLRNNKKTMLTADWDIKKGFYVQP
jgi:hypothetical protein